ncbi:MAG: lamin tail domain-containing protein [Proteobacteria bacterium]|nr:lamin tail domain-containing protein [Pseudomonadota bacterium]
MSYRLAFVSSSLASLLFVGCGPSGGSGAGCKDKLIAGDLVITEVFADFQAPTGGSGVDEGKEWFEVYNASDRPLELEGLTLVHSRPDGSKSKSHEMTTVTIAPGQFLVLGNSAADLLPPYVDYGYSADLGELFNTDGGLLALKCGSTEIDSAQYNTVKSGHSRELTSAQPPDYTVNDDLAQWCQGDATEFDPGNFGTPGADNDCTPIVVGQCNDGGTMRDAVAPVPGDLVISEIMTQPSGDDALQEWIELAVVHDVDLNGLGVSRPSTTTGASTVDSPDCIHVTAGSYVVLAKSVDPTMNGGLPPTAIVGTFKGALSLVNGSTGTPGDLQITYNGVALDTVTWTKTTANTALQLDPDLIDTTANDSPSNFCDATAIYDVTSANKGSPGMGNVQCNLLPPAGMCADAGTNRSIVKPAAGQLVITEALANPAGTGTDATQEWFEITNTGAAAFDLNELTLKGTSTTNAIAVSDCVSVTAGGFAVFAHSTDPTANGGLPAVAATFTFALATTASVLDGTTVLDQATWSTGTAPDGKSRQLKTANTNPADNDVTTNFCDAQATQTYGTTTNLGTPGLANVCP